MKIRKYCSLTFICAIITTFSYAQNFDIDVVRSINGNSSNFKNELFNATSNSVTFVNIAAPLGLLTAGFIKHDDELKKQAAYMAGGFIASAIITQGMKRVIKRNRPFVTYPYIIQKDEGGGYSMPSGHTSAAFCTATSLSLLFPKWYVIAPAYLYATAVGYGRMYEGVHYPTDVFVGAVVGAGSAWLAYKAEKWMDRKHQAKKMVALAF